MMTESDSLPKIAWYARKASSRAPALWMAMNNLDGMSSIALLIGRKTINTVISTW